MSVERDAAIRELRRTQEKARRRLGGEYSKVRDDVLDETLEAANRREKEAEILGDRVRVFAFSYPLVQESKRWARTKDIILRSAPGPDEDPSYLEMIARQAASVEMILRQEHGDTPNARAADFCDRVLLATAPTFSPTAYAATHRSYFNVLISAGLIDFLYQLTKIVVLSWDITRSPDGRVAAKGRPEDMDRVLEKDHKLLEQLLHTYLSYLHKGIPRVTGYSPPSTNHQFPLTMITAFNERFVLAHEYGHALLDALGFDAPENMTRHNEEFRADVLAFQLVAESGFVLDGVPPVTSSQGCFFVLTALETLRRARDIACYGEIRRDEGFASHPPVSTRYDLLKQVYLEQVSNKDDHLSINGALTASNSLMHLWRKIQPLMIELRKPDVPLHPMWL